MTASAPSSVRGADDHYRQIVESAVDYAIVGCDEKGVVTSWNEGACRLLGWTEEEMLGQSVARFFTSQDVAAGAVEAEMETARQAGRALDERWHQRKGGMRFWASGSLMPLKGDNGAITGFVKILRDRTQERESQAQLRLLNDTLRASQAQLQAALDERNRDLVRRQSVERDLKFLAEASTELAKLSDDQPTLEKLAQLAVRHFADWCAIDILVEGNMLRRVAVAHADPAKEELVRQLHERFPPDPARISSGGPWSILRTGRSECVQEVSEGRLERFIGDPRYRAALRELGVRSYIGVPLTVRGKTLGVIIFLAGEFGRRYSAEDCALAEDLARRAAVAIENANLLRALQDSDRAKDVFLATLAHELRNPLAPVWNGLSIIKHVASEPARVRQVSEMIERQVVQLARLVDDLLDVSRITTGKIELKKEPADLLAILRSAIETSRPHFEAAGHRLTVEFPDRPAYIEADRVRLAQVFSNLLNNAAKYTRPGGEIAVLVNAEPEKIVVRVRDNGAGIAPEMLGKVFTLFAQATHPAERSQGGLGIGLSLVDGLVRLHGGSVTARSDGLDKGSEFIVTLPCSEAVAPPASPAPAAASVPSDQSGKKEAGTRRRILVVDDNQDAANTVAELLRMLGSEVMVAHDGNSAVAQVAPFAPDVVLLDIGLPDINGYQVARRIRELGNVTQPRLIALTGWGQEQDKKLASEAGFDEHWTKPVDPGRLQQLAR